MSYQRIGNYMVGGFIGGLGLFNSSKLEVRQATETNAELIFQNGQIISAVMMFVCCAGILCEFFVMRNLKNKTPTKVVSDSKEQQKDNKESQKDLKIEGGKIKYFDPIPQDEPTFKRSKKKRKYRLDEIVPMRKKSGR